MPEKGFRSLQSPRLSDGTSGMVCLPCRWQEFTDTLTTYEKEIQRLLSPLGERAKFLGHQPRDAVRHYEETSEICIVPSLWQEPGEADRAEALAAGSAPYN